MTSSELKSKCYAAGIDPSGMSVKKMKESLALLMWANEHPGEEFPEQYDPMLAKDVSMADAQWIDKQFRKEGYILQQKINGMRSIASIRPDGTIWMTSRERSSKDFMFTPHHDKVLGFQNIKSPFAGVTVFDGELICENPRVKLPSGVETTSTLQSTVALTHMNAKQSIEVQQKYGSLVYMAFDILKLDGESTEDLPYRTRLELLTVAVERLKEVNPGLPIKLVKTVTDFDSAYRVFQEFIENGAEGIMVKKADAPYQQGKRSSDLLKIKGLVDIDAFVTGSVPSSEDKAFKDLIGGLTFSMYIDGKLKEVAAVSNIDLQTRKDATVIENGKPTLNPAFLNRCAALVGQDFNEKSGRLNSARINEWRDDKRPEDCKMSSADLKFNGQNI